MSQDVLSRRILLFVNVAHALDHYVLLIYPTAVIAIAAQTGLGYADLLGLSTGAFVAFGLCSLPVGWLADRIGRRAMLAAFFLGYGLSCLGVASASSPPAFAVWLLVLGVASAIYHPVGAAMLVSHARRLGHDLGVNAVWGNLGGASASGATALVAATLGWRLAFVLPGLACLALGAAFLALVPREGAVNAPRASGPTVVRLRHPAMLLGVFTVAVVAGGITFTVVTVALPKVVDERLGLDLPLALTGVLATGVFAFGALAQWTMGRLIDRVALPTLFVGLAVLQPLGLALAAGTHGVLLLVGLVLVAAAIYGQVVVNDAMVARYVPARYRSRAFGVRYFLGFTVSGFVVPLVAWLHAGGGFGQVLAGAALCGAAVWASALGFYALAQDRAPIAAA